MLEDSGESDHWALHRSGRKPRGKQSKSQNNRVLSLHVHVGHVVHGSWLNNSQRNEPNHYLCAAQSKFEQTFVLSSSNAMACRVRSNQRRVVDQAQQCGLKKLREIHYGKETVESGTSITCTTEGEKLALVLPASTRWRAAFVAICM